MPLPLRLAVLITLVLLTAVLITARLNYAKFVQVTETLDNSRYTFLAQDLKATLEASLDLGLPLDQIQNAQEVVERQRERYPEILAITVFDDKGRVLYNSGRARPDLVERLQKQKVVAGVAEGDRIAATPLVNPFGAIVGGVEVRVSARGADERNDTMVASLGSAVLSAAALGTAAVALIAVVLLHGVRKRLALQARIIASIGETEAALAAPAASGRFHKAASQALDELRAVEQLVEQTRRQD
ncbi:hypothetical protein SAMN06265365_14021 [Tistlia consotensis]|uniref:Uncharacterized protein n=1 Tax=Tistlia consotensis USBA 355 TaxID=560819 RepID=A0A1Y6CP70_9PROT|nr:hypothetical protein [Tistlia consotensis]SMF81262.1 hypothetical protein SAMN05428998_14317 [Tistlia consotensis USBA 355]SNS23118.1 hypothetical protein SAMN06265365_14021 [Tistlia consotensis]